MLSILGLVAMMLDMPGTLLARLTPWEVWFLGLLLMVAGSGLFGLAGLRAGEFARLGFGLLLIAGLAVIPMLVGMAGLVAWEPVDQHHGPRAHGHLRRGVDRPRHQRPARHRSQPHQARRSVPVKRLVRPALGAVLLLALAATPALANHSHVKLLGNGQCVVLAEGGWRGRRRPAAVRVQAQPERGRCPRPVRRIRSTCSCTGASPASVGSYAVFGSAEGNALCAGGYVNR